jgi:hypothetical protein
MWFSAVVAKGGKTGCGGNTAATGLFLVMFVLRCQR